jgi:hypothetical protein
MLGWQNPTNSSKVGIFDKAGMAVNIAGSASHGGRSTDRIAANNVSTAAIANSSDTVDTGNPNRDRSRDHMPEPVYWGYPR